MNAAKEEQARIQKEIELLKVTGEEESAALKARYEQLVQEAKDNEKVILLGIHIRSVFMCLISQLLLDPR